MKKTFIRALWGIPDTSQDKSADGGWINPSVRRKRMDGDVDIIMNNPYTVPFITYVFGRDNYDFLMSKGLNCILLDERPFIYDLQKEFWRHKLDILKYAMEVDKYDEIVYLDWDCIPQKPMSENFWTLLSNKREVQCNLQYYTRKKCTWRGEIDVRKVSNGGFIYIRDPKIPQALIDTWLKFTPDLRFWDEVSISKFIDELMGGWKGIDAYWTDFEPLVCNLKKKSAFKDKPELITGKDIYFIHFIQSANNEEAKKRIY